jgi:hypothetical protein
MLPPPCSEHAFAIIAFPACLVIHPIISWESCITWNLRITINLSRGIPSPLILRMTLDTDAERLALPVVLILRASSGIEKPGMVVPYMPPSRLSDTEELIPRGKDRSKSVLKESSSDTTGVKDTRGGATWHGITLRDGGRSVDEREDSLEEWFCTTDVDGRLRSAGAALEAPAAVVPVAAVGGADDRGAVNVLFTMEKREVMRA